MPVNRKQYDVESVFTQDELEAGQADVDIFNGKEPHPTQLAFLESSARHKAYIGNVGSGKTEAICWADMLVQHLFPPNFTLVARFTYAELRDTTRKRYVEVANPKLILRASLPENGDGYIDWKNGGTTIFRNLDTDQKFGSLELGGSFIDEVSECPERCYWMLDARTGRFFTGARRGTYAPLDVGGNPGGRDYIWKLFFKPRKEADKDPDYQGFHPQPHENEAALPPGYYKNLAKGKPDWWIRRFIKGDLGALEGLVWPNFDDSIHVIQPFPIPRNWRRLTGHDHGQRNPTACLWSAVDTDGNLIVYRDYQEAGLVPAQHCRNILLKDKAETIESRVADPSMFNKTIPTPNSDKWHSVAEEYAMWGVELERADNAMEASLARVSTLLWPDPGHPFPAWHPKAGQPGSPRLFFFVTCEGTIEDVSAWRFKEYAVESLGLREEPVDVNDHRPDCLRYICVSLPEPSVGDKVPVVVTPSQHRALRVARLSRMVRRQAKQQADLEADFIYGED